ncbi:hypothetical protein Q9L58_008239 [Maublancomyces gigas]|uniref:Uncharacterized protein n=1 Tax=Discina gigas TaxID=1032678 RepID=A0ABR3GA87_9PEZI
MSSSDTASTDSSKHSIEIVSFETQATHLRPQLVFDSALLLLPPSQPSPQEPPQEPPKEKQQDAHTTPHAPSDKVPLHFPLIHPEDAQEIPLDIEGDILGIDSGDDDDDEISAEELALICRTRQQKRGPPPGTARVLKKVRVRKQESSSKRRTKKQKLRVQLQKQDRIEEEMAQFRGKGKTKEPSKPGRRYIPTDSAPGSRPPSSLRFSESCYDEGDLDDDPITCLGNPEVSVEYGLNTPIDNTPSHVT